MSREIDERVVQMQFENGVFERNIQTSIRSLNELKKGMNFDSAVNGFEKVNKASKAIKLDPLTAAVETLNSKFNLLGITAFNVMNRISNAAINAGENFVRSLTIDQVGAGWTKYGEKTKAVQTIMAATAKEFTDTGKQMEFVSDQLDKLNWFTDVTSYNFIDMVNNIGKFTSNQIPLEQSVTAMQGIANWAAISGANAVEASRAMYNLSQAISIGSIQLMDWKSIELANMGTAQFKETAIEAALAAGTLVKGIDGVTRTLKGNEVTVKSFRQNLTDAWLTSDVLLKTLDMYGGAANQIYQIIEQYPKLHLTAATLVSNIEGYNKGTKTAEEVSKAWGMSVEEADKILKEFNSDQMKFGLEAFRAAQEVKTLGEMIIAVGDEVSSGWLKSFELIFGNYEQAKKFWTDMMETFSALFAGGASARNRMLQEWNDMGGRDIFIDSIYGVLASILSILGPIKKAWNDIFGSMTAKKLYELTNRFHSFILSIILTEESSENLRKTFRGLFAVLDIGRTIFGGAFKIALDTIRTIFKELNLDVLGFTGNMGDGIVSIRDWLKEGSRFNNIVSAISNSISEVIRHIAKFVRGIGELDAVKKVSDAIQNSVIPGIKDFTDSLFSIEPNFDKIGNKISAVKDQFNISADAISKAGKSAAEKLSEYFGDVEFSFDGILSIISKSIKGITSLSKQFIEQLGEAASEAGGIFKRVADALREVDWAGVTLLASGIVIIALLWKFAAAFELVAKAIDNFGGVFGAVKEAFKSIGGYFDALKKNIQVNNIFKAALAIGVLAVALSVLAHIDFKALAVGAGAIFALMVALGVLTVVVNKFGKEGDQAKTIAGLVSIAAAIAVLAVALNAIKVDKDLPARFRIVGVALIAMFAIMKFSGSRTAKSFVNASSILAMAAGVYIIVKALNNLKEITPKDLGTIIPVLSLIMLALVIIGRVLNSGFILEEKQSVKAAVSVMGILAMIVALKAVIGAIKDLGKTDPTVLYSGVIAFIPVFVALLALSGAIRLAGDNIAKAGVFFIAIGVALKLMIGAIKGLGGISNSVADRGLSVIARLSLIFSALIAVSKLAGEHSAKVGVMMIGMAASLAIIQLVIKTLGKTDFLVLTKGLAAVTTVMLAFVPLVKATSGERSKETVKALTKIAIIIGLLGVVIAGLSLLDPVRALSATASLSAVLLSLGAFFKLTENIKVPKLGEFFKIISFVTVMATILGIMGAITDPKGVLAVATGMSEVLLALSVAGVIMKKGGTPSETNAKAMRVFVLSVGGIMAALAIIVGIVNAIGGSMKGILILTTGMSEVLLSLSAASVIMGKVRGPNTDNIKAMNKWVISVGVLIAGLAIIQAAINKSGGSIDGVLLLTTGMSEILVSLALATRIIGKQRIETPKPVTLATLAIMVTAIGGIIALFSSWTDPTKVIPYATAVSEVIVALSGAVRILTRAGRIDASAIGMMTILTGLTTVMGVVLASMSNIVNPMTVLPIATGMSAVMLALAGIVKIISMTPPAFLTGAWASLGMMATIVVALGALAGVLGALYQIPAFQQILNDSGAAMADFGKAIGGFFGGIVGGFVGGAIEGVVDLIPYIGQQITEFMKAANLGFVMMKKHSEGLLSAASEVAGAILIFTAADFLSGIGSFLGSVLGSKDSGLAERFTIFGNALVAFSDSLGEDFDAENVKAAAEAGKALAELENNLPRQNGKLQEWLGSKTLDTFGDRIKIFGEAIVTFSNTVTGAEGKVAVNKKAVDAAADAGAMLAKLEESIPSQGGELQRFLGSKTLDDFGSRMEKFGDGIVNFSKKVTGADGGAVINEDAVQAAVDAGSLLTSLEKGIPPQDGVLQAFLGSSSLDDFGSRLGVLATALVDFGEDTENLKVGNIVVAASALQTLVDLENSIEANGGLGDIFFGKNNFSSFGENLKDLGAALGVYDEKIESIDLTKMDSMSTSLTSLLDIAARAITDGSGFLSFGGNLRAFAVNLDTFSTSATNADTESIDQMRLSINALLRLSEFTDSQKWLNDIISTAKLAITQIQVSLALRHQSIKKSGENLAYWFVQGFKMGMDNNLPIAKESAIALAKAVDKAVRDTLLIHSPSAVMEEEGKWVVRGLAEGIAKDTSAEEAAAKKAQNVVNAFQTVLATISAKSQRADLEYQLWEQTAGLNLKDSEKNNRQLLLKTQQLEYAAEQVRAQKATLDTLKQTVGETSAEYAEAYNNYLSSMIAMYEKKNEIDKMAQTDHKTDQQLLIEYTKIREAYAETFERLGWSEEQQHDFAAKKSGYGIQEVERNMVDTNAIIAKALQDQSITIEESVAQATSTALEKGVSTVIPKTKELGKDLTDGLGEGITDPDSVEKLKDSVDDEVNGKIGAGKALLEKWKEYWQTNSPSKVTYELGTFITEGLANGLLDPDKVAGVINAGQAVANGTLTAMQPTISSFQVIGQQAMAGFRDGIVAIGVEAIAAAQQVASQVAATMSATLQVNSPSRVTRDIGKNVSLGLSNGMLDKIDYVTNASDTLCKKTISILDETRSAVDNLLSFNDEYAPTITPVLNMDTLKQQAKGIHGLFGNRSGINLGIVNARVGAIAATEGSVLQNGNSQPAQNNYNFTQNNYSPKALSRAEIYRDTKNQFARFKGVTGRR